MLGYKLSYLICSKLPLLKDIFIQYPCVDVESLSGLITVVRTNTGKELDKLVTTVCYGMVYGNGHLFQMDQTDPCYAPCKASTNFCSTFLIVFLLLFNILYNWLIWRCF